jgi:pimeloyl-ACP methyl ester carboxylesterase
VGHFRRRAACARLRGAPSRSGRRRCGGRRACAVRRRRPRLVRGPSFETLLSPPDHAVLPELQDFFGQTFREATGTGINGWLDDDLAFTRPWGFDVSEIRVPVLLLHGLQDGFVPRDHARWLVSRIPGIEARLFEDEGHLSLYARIPEVHEWLSARF